MTEQPQIRSDIQELGFRSTISATVGRNGHNAYRHSWPVVKSRYT